MTGVLAAATGSDWNAGGSIMTFFFPVGLFVVVAAILYLLISRPHRRIPPRRALAPNPEGASGQGGSQDKVGQPDRETPATDGTDADE